MNNSNKGKLAVIYCRVSTEEQATKGLSIEVQESVCKKEIEKEGYSLFKIIKDEGKSAGSLKRPGIQEVIKLASEKKINAVFAIHSDRIARNTLDYLNLRELFRKNEIALKFIYQPLSDETAASRTMDTVMASFNEMQLLITSEKTKSSLYAKASEGYFPSLPPPGYINSENPEKNVNKLAKRIIMPDSVKAPLVVEAFKLYATGNYNVYDLNDLMYQRGLRNKHDNKIAPSRFYGLLKNRFYIGEVKWGKIFVREGKHTPLIDEALFNQVQTILASNNQNRCRRRKHSWLLNGFVFCHKHQLRYTAEWHLNKRKAYYHCTNTTGCSRYFEHIELENEIADKFKELEFNPFFVNKVIEKAKAIFFERRKTYENKRQSLVNQKTAWEAKRKIAENKLFEGIISDDDFTRIRSEINAELNNVAQRLNELEGEREINVDIAQEILSFTKDIYKSFKKASFQLKRHYLGFFWNRFEIYDKVIIKSVPSPLFEELLKLNQISYKLPDFKNPIENNNYGEVIISNNRGD